MATSSSSTKNISCSEWLKSFTPLEVLLSCSFVIATLAFIIALVVRINTPLAGCVDFCRRPAPNGYVSKLSMRYMDVPEFDREVLKSGREGLATAPWHPDVPREVRIGEFPFLGSVSLEDDALCMTIIVSKRWCLSAATCYLTLDAGLVYVLMERDAAGELTGSHTIKNAIVHDQYKPGAADNDIVALQSADDFMLSPDKFMTLPLKRHELDMATGDMVIIMGWAKKPSKDDEIDINIITGWPVILTWDRRLNTSVEVYDKAGVFAHGPHILFIISKLKRTIKLSDHRDWIAKVEAENSD